MHKATFLILSLFLALFAYTALAPSPSMGLSARPGKALKAGEVRLNPRDIHVIDGDSFQAQGQVYDLAFIDAPEIGQVCARDERLWHCGLDAAYALRKIFDMESGPMTCSVTPHHSTLRADCVTGTIDLSEHLLLEGFVTAQDNAPRHYRMTEDKARDAGLGLWRGTFVPPPQWREGKRLPGEHPHLANEPILDDLPWHFDNGRLYYDPEEMHMACIVKGKKQEDGSRVYYTPLDDDYDETPVIIDRGDKIFCGDDNARAHGFRHVGEVDGIAPVPD